MKMNSLMADHWARVVKSQDDTALLPALAELAASPLVKVEGALVLKELFDPTRDRPKAGDLTGFEAGVNKIHIEDFTGKEVRWGDRLLQGIKYAESLLAGLTSYGKPFRLILSRDPDSDAVVVLFYVRRPDQPWSSDDVEDYKLDEVIQWDT